jgi:hypothetical protein
LIVRTGEGARPRRWGELEWKERKREDEDEEEERTGQKGGYGEEDEDDDDEAAVKTHPKEREKASGNEANVSEDWRGEGGKERLASSMDREDSLSSSTYIR